MIATTAMLHAIVRTITHQRRAPFAICVDARIREDLIHLLSDWNYPYAMPRLDQLRELRIRGVQIGSVV